MLGFNKKEPEPTLDEQIIVALKTVQDPELGVNVWDLGLIYQIKIPASRFVVIDMTLTSPGCPAAGILPGQVARAAKAVPGVAGVSLNLVWDPPWSAARVSREGRWLMNYGR
uniref:MIP18 family-like domain-containing protein n=1 Tax=Magnetococcus massalia (strain MO-1) TaxID=451514 RepID=A0A1S7LGB8_MAGMO|nr:conserved protein of unknown function(Include DUF59 domain) [Candidatus Magnetococcus massalia]